MTLRVNSASPQPRTGNRIIMLSMTSCSSVVQWEFSFSNLVVNFQLTESKVNWSPNRSMTINNKFLVVFFFQCVFFVLFKVWLTCWILVFVVNQKEKYWANHSWRWASGESMDESFVSGGLQGTKPSQQKTKTENTSQGREMLIQHI